MAQPDPATATFAMFDPTASYRPQIGAQVTINATATPPQTGVATSTACFLGRITTATIEPTTLGNVAGTLISCTAASILNDLANRVPAEAWPDETMGARLTRIAAYTTPQITTCTLRVYWQTPHAQPIAQGSQPSVLDSLMGLIGSAGPDRFTYLPAQRLQQFIARRDLSTRTSAAQLWWNVAGDGTNRDGTGAYARSIAQSAVDGSMPGVNLYVDAKDCHDIAGLTRDMASQITRVDVNHQDSGNSYAARTEETLVSSIPLSTVDESVIGIRTASLSSICTWNSYAVQASSDLAYLAAREAAGWRPSEPMIYDAGFLGRIGFESWDHIASLFLVGGEVQSLFFLQRSWLPALGIRPVFAIIGATMTYSDGAWQIACNLEHVNTSPMPQHAIAWEEIDDGSTTYQLNWTDSDDPHGLHETLTWGDIDYVGAGLNVATGPTSARWDAIY